MATARVPSQGTGISGGEWSAETAELPGAHELDFLPPDSLNRPLWRSLLANLRDYLFPQELPPLQLTSQPVEVIMPLGALLSLPWYRTIFSNLGEVMAPETLPPLQLESRPVEVGELVSDRMSHPWWSSLVRSLGEVMAPPQLPPLELTAAPVNPGLSSVGLLVPRWSSLISLPQVSSGQKEEPAEARPDPMVAEETEPAPAFPGTAAVPLEAMQADADSVLVLVSQFKDDLSRARRREIFWIGMISLLFLLAWYLGWIRS